MRRSGRSRCSRRRTGHVAARGTTIMRFVVGAQQAMTGRREAITEHMPRLRDDRGAVSVEMAIIMAILGAAAVALATYIATVVIPGWQSEIPTGGGG